MELLTNLLPVIVTGITTFLVTKYTMSWNVPLDNMKISYNRVYYPLYREMRDTSYEDVNHHKIQELMDHILLKYDKYVSSSTIRTYKNYLKAFSQENKLNAKIEYMQFYDDVIVYNSKLRGKLGYVRASFHEAYKALPKPEKMKMCLSFSFLLLYFMVLLFNVLKWYWLVYIVILLIVYMCYIGIYIGATFIKKKIINIFAHLKLKK